MGLPQLIPEIHADDPRVVPVPLGELFGAVHEHALWELSAPPQPVAVLVGTAPLAAAGVVVQDHHETHLGQHLHRYVEDLHPALVYQLGVGCQVLLGHRPVVVEQLQRVRQPDAVHLELVPDIQGYVPQRTALQPIDAMPAHVRTRPVAPCQLDPPASRVDDLDALGRQGQLHLLHVEQGSLRNEV